MSPSAVSVVFGISLEAWISDLRSGSCHWSISSKILKFLKHKAVLVDAQCLSINTQSHSLFPPLGLRTAETTVRKGRRNSGALGCLQVPTPSPHVLFSYHIQPRTILFSNSTWACEAHESLPWSHNLSCNRLMKIVLQEQLCVRFIPQVIAQIPPHSANCTILQSQGACVSEGGEGRGLTEDSVSPTRTSCI